MNVVVNTAHRPKPLKAGDIFQTLFNCKENFKF